VKKLNALVHERGGIIETHQSSCCVPMILGYADSYFDGEHIVGQYDGGRTGFLNTGAIRAEFTGVNFGVPIQFLLASANYKQDGGLMFLYGVQCKPYFHVNSVEEASPIWRIINEFGARDEQFYPFWRGDCPVKSDNGQVFCSAWVADDKILAVVVNLSGAGATVKLTVDNGFRAMRIAGEDGSLDPAGLLNAPPFIPCFLEIERQN